MGFFDEDDRKFNIGDRVKVKYREQEGYITDINGDLYTVSLDDGMFIDSCYEDVSLDDGMFIDSCYEDELERY